MSITTKHEAFNVSVRVERASHRLVLMSAALEDRNWLIAAAELRNALAALGEASEELVKQTAKSWARAKHQKMPQDPEVPF